MTPLLNTCLLILDILHWFIVHLGKRPFLLPTSLEVSSKSSLQPPPFWPRSQLIKLPSISMSSKKQWKRKFYKHFLPHLCACSVPELCPTLLKSVDCSPQGFSVRGISQARILEWVAIFFSRGSSLPRDQTHIFCMVRQILYHWITREAPLRGVNFH